MATVVDEPALVVVAADVVPALLELVTARLAAFAVPALAEVDEAFLAGVDVAFLAEVEEAFLAEVDEVLTLALAEVDDAFLAEVDEVLAAVSVLTAGAEPVTVTVLEAALALGLWADIWDRTEDWADAVLDTVTGHCVHTEAEVDATLADDVTAEVAGLAEVEEDVSLMAAALARAARAGRAMISKRILAVVWVKS